MKTTLLKLSVCILLAFQSYCQNPVWVMPPYFLSQGISYLLPIEPSLSNGGNNDEFEPYDYYDGNVAKQGSNGIANLDGDLNFFIIDGNIYSGIDGRFLCYAWGNYSKSPSGYVQETPINDPVTFEQVGYELNNLGSNEIMIVPHPTNCNQYYLFSSIYNPPASPSSNYVPFYALFDLEQEKIIQGGPWYGDSDPLSSILPFFNEYGPHVNGNITITNGNWADQIQRTGAPNLSTSAVQADGSRFILAAMGSLILVLKMDNTGIVNIWKIYAVPIPNELSGSNRNEGELFQDPISGNFSFAFAKENDQAFPVPNTPGSRFIQIVNYTNDFLSVIGPLEYYQINASLGMNPPAVHGLEFSPDGSKLYATISTSLDNPTSLVYVDRSLVIPQIVQFDPSKNLNEIQYSQIETDANGNLVFASANGLYELSNPNNPLPSNLSSAPITTFPYNLTSGTIYPLNPETQLYSLPDQIDFEDYSTLFPSGLSCCVANSTFDRNSFTAQTSATWKPNGSGGSNPLTTTNSNVVTIRDELRIPAGKSIYLTDMTIKFAPEARLIIENGASGSQGGKLILVNSTLTVDDGCSIDEMWLGVEVWGNQNQSQGSLGNTSQGLLRMYNGSKIEHAKIGVLLSKRDPLNVNSYIDAQNGGVFQASDNSVFYNNRTGVYFRKHSSPGSANNLSKFTKTIFNWDDNIHANAQPKDHIKMDQVKGINIRGCEFNQLSPDSYAIGQQGYGINAYISQFYVDGNCNVIQPLGQPCPNYSSSEFNDLNYGIFAYYGTTPLSFSVNESEFNNCRYGIYSQRSEAARITKNKFNVLEENFQTAGCLMYYSSGFTIQENDFKEQDNALITHGNGQSYGVIINNSGIVDNEVYKNDFTNLKVGGQSEYLNGSQSGTVHDSTSGLNWTCNNFFSDIYLTDLGIRGVIDKEQGIVDASNIDSAQYHAARNSFSIAATTNTEHDIMVYNYSPPYNVFPHQQTIDYVQLDDPFHIANDKDGLVATQFAQFNNMNVAPFGTTCPTKIKPVGGIKFVLKKLKSSGDSLRNMIDNGNTVDLLNVISNNPRDVSVKNSLISYSPYLSDAVMLHYMANCTNNSYVKDVLIANSKLSSSLYEAVLSSTLPIGTKNAITRAQSGSSERDKLYSKINWTMGEYVSEYNNLKSVILLDTTELADFSLLMSELDSINDLRAKQDLYLLAVELQDEVMANDLKTEINRLLPSDFFKIVDATIALQGYSSYEIGLTENSSIYNDLNTFSENSDWFYGSATVRNILSCVDGVVGVPEFLSLVSPSSIMIANDGANESGGSSSRLLPLQVSIYPNPSNGNVYFDLPNEEVGTLVIQLIDITGKEIYSAEYEGTNGQLVDFSEIKKGTYIVRITLDNSYSESQLLQLKD